jgi:Esterase/lipase
MKRVGRIVGIARKLTARAERGKYKRRAGKEMFLDTEAGRVRVLAYGFDDSTRRPLFIDIHGGGFVLMSAESDDPYMPSLAEKAGVKILGVDYSLAPEAKFPKALDECHAVVKYAGTHRDELNIGDIAIGGHSAGGNLSAAVCLVNAERPELDVKALILDYPPLDLATDPYEKPKPRGAIPPKMATLFNAAYCKKEEAANPLVSPLFAKEERLAAFPPTLIITAEGDSLCEEGEEFARKLEKAGVNITKRRFAGKHGFTLSNTPAAFEAWDLMAEHLRKYLKIPEKNGAKTYEEGRDHPWEPQKKRQ